MTLFQDLFTLTNTWQKLAQGKISTIGDINTRHLDNSLKDRKKATS